MTVGFSLRDVQDVKVMKGAAGRDDIVILVGDNTVFIHGHPEGLEALRKLYLACKRVGEHLKGGSDV